MHKEYAHVGKHGQSKVCLTDQGTLPAASCCACATRRHKKRVTAMQGPLSQPTTRTQTHSRMRRWKHHSRMRWCKHPVLSRAVRSSEAMPASAPAQTLLRALLACTKTPTPLPASLLGWHEAPRWHHSEQRPPPSAASHAGPAQGSSETALRSQPSCACTHIHRGKAWALQCEEGTARAHRKGGGAHVRRAGVVHLRAYRGCKMPWCTHPTVHTTYGAPHGILHVTVHIAARRMPHKARSTSQCTS